MRWFIENQLLDKDNFYPSKFHFPQISCKISLRRQRRMSTCYYLASQASPAGQMYYYPHQPPDVIFAKIFDKLENYLTTLLVWGSVMSLQVTQLSLKTVLMKIDFKITNCFERSFTFVSRNRRYFGSYCRFKTFKVSIFFSIPLTLEALILSLILTMLSFQTSTSSDTLVHQWSMLAGSSSHFILSRPSSRLMSLMCDDVWLSPSYLTAVPLIIQDYTEALPCEDVLETFGWLRIHFVSSGVSPLGGICC